MKNDVRDAIAAKFVEALNAGVIPWRKPWVAGQGRPRNATTGKPYRGVNAMYLGLIGSLRGYTSSRWLTLNQCRKEGGRVKYEEMRNGTAVIFWKFMKREEDRPDGLTVIKTFPLCRSFTVYNVDQCEGLPEKITTAKDVPTFTGSPIESAQKIIDGMPNRPTLNIIDSEHAYYAPMTDTVVVPKMEQFVSSEAFYSTTFHELAHATGHGSRLNRDGVMQGKGFGSESYSKEELIAEMTAAFLSSECGILDKVEQNSTAYVQHWAKRIGSEPRLIIDAAAAAQKATDFILGVKFGTDSEE